MKDNNGETKGSSKAPMYRQKQSVANIGLDSESLDSVVPKSTTTKINNYNFKKSNNIYLEFSDIQNVLRSTTHNKYSTKTQITQQVVPTKLTDEQETCLNQLGACLTHL